MTEQQADAIIVLLTSIKDELQRPRLERERTNELARQQIMTANRESQAATERIEAERAAAARDTVWIGGVGIATARTAGGG